MFTKLARRNVKRQLGNYLIYFITVSLTVALMFAINNVIFSKQMLKNAEMMDSLMPGLIAITIFVALIVAFILGYATSFMLKLRKREFGTYLTLGMTRRNILNIFIMETMLMCVAALAVGIALGLFIYQGMMAIMTRLMEIELAFADYSLKGLLLTVVLVCGMFLLSSVASALYLRKVKIYDLIHGDRMVDKKVKHPVFWLIVMLMAMAAIVVSVFVFRNSIKAIFTSSGGTTGIFVSIGVIAVAIVIMHIALARSVANLMLKNKKLCNMGTNTFTLRQLSGKLNSNSIMAGILALLLAFAIIGANVSFTEKISEQLTIDKYYPFDVTMMYDHYNFDDSNDEKSPISIEEGEQIIDRYSKIKDKVKYKIYDTGDNYLYSFTPWKGEGYTAMTDTVISESDFNKLWTALGHKPVDLEDGFKIVAYEGQVKNLDFSKANLPLGDKTYPYKGMIEGNMFFFTYVLAIVPDEAVSGLKIASDCEAYDMVKDRYDAVSMRDDLSYPGTIEYNEASVDTQLCDYYIKEYARIDRNNFSAIFVIGAIYIAVVFIFMAMAILALKTLSGLNEDKQRYRILFQLGASAKEQSRTLFRQIFSFFFLPFAVPILMSFPTAYLCGDVLKQGGVDSGTGMIYVIAGIITAAMIIIYALYFMATYLIAKRNVVHRES
ncbi:MAG: ABC transporter permease [Clostridiales bacterium]|nr:ABC transporter permease [Clostridiales bacterium]